MNELDNVRYLDQYPALRKEAWLRRLDAQRHLGVISIAWEPAPVINFPQQIESNDAS